jgi:GDP-4-dehydro-6-deoxy-D-mannose reductase
MRILITGASGFIGRYLSTYALELGHEVVGTCLSPEEVERGGPYSPHIKWEPLDMRVRPQISSLVERIRPDAVFHLAAQAYAQKAWLDPVDTFETNVIGTIGLYETLRQYTPKNGVLLAASGSAYGVPPRLPISEDFPLNPTNPYGVSKAAQEMLSLQYSLNFDLRIIRARLFGTTGPGKTGDALNDFARQIAILESGHKPGKLRVGNLRTVRDVSDIRDVVRAMWLVFEKGSPTEPVNVGAGLSYSIGWIADKLVHLSKVPIEIEQDPALLRPTDEPDNRADINRLQRLGHRPEVTMEQTITDSLQYWRSRTPP